MFISIKTRNQCLIPYFVFSWNSSFSVGSKSFDSQERPVNW